MIAMRHLLCLLTSLSLAAAAHAADSYLCVAELTTGFTYDAGKKSWKSADFRSEKKLAITRARQKPYAWEAKEVGDSRPAATCERAHTHTHA